MWIESTRTDDDGNPVHAGGHLSPPGTDERAEFTENGKAQVTKPVAEQFAQHYDHIQPTDSDDSDESRPDSGESAPEEDTEGEASDAE